MNPSISSLRKAFLFSGALFLGWAVQAQSDGSNNSSSDTTHRNGMHRHWAGPGRKGSDSLAKRDGMAFHRQGQSGREGFGGHNGFGRNREGFGRGRGGFGHGRERFAGRGDRGPGVRYTPEQRRQVMAINKEYHQKSEELFKKDNTTLKEYKAGLLALQKEKKTKLEALLTQKQKEERLARTKRMSENGQVMAAARMERLKIRLNLSDDQVAKIKAGQENLHNQAKAIHENDNLLPQQKMDQMKDLMARRNDTFKSVLTPDQYSKFEQFSHRKPGGFGGQRRPGRGGDDHHPGNGPANGGEETK